MIRRYRGKTKFLRIPVLVSCPASEGSMMSMQGGYASATGGVGSATAHNERPQDLIGIIRHTIKTTDDDYATARDVEVEVPVENNVEWEIDLNGGLVAADVGLYIDFFDASTAVRANSTYDHMRVVKRISATKAVVVFNMGLSGFGVGGDS